ncbi:hypothetical protein ACU4GD_23730 [Cupriavidus basilensis]
MYRFLRDPQRLRLGRWRLLPTSFLAAWPTAAPFRVTEAVYHDRAHARRCLALKLGIDKTELRLRNFIRKDQFRISRRWGLSTIPADYETALRKVLDAVDYPALRAGQSSAAG